MDVVQEVLVWVKHSFNRGLLVVTIVATYCIALSVENEVLPPPLSAYLAIPHHTKFYK